MILATGFLDLHINSDGSTDKCEEILQVLKNPTSALSLPRHRLLAKPTLLEGFAK